LSGTESSAERATNATETHLDVFSPEELSTELELDGRLLYLNTDYRDILDIIGILHGKHPYPIKARACLEIFVDNWEDIKDGQRAMLALYNFIDCGEKPQNTKGLPKELDWKVDFSAIISDMNKVSKVEDIRAVPYMHWFTFISIFNAIGEGNLSHRIGIRRKIRKHEKLSPDEIDWATRNPDKLLIERDRYSDDDDEED